MESSRSCQITKLVFKSVIYFHLLPPTVIFLHFGNVLINRGLFSYTQLMALTILKSSIPSRGIDTSILISARHRFRGLDKIRL
jgi:hypothetical protein